MAIDAGASRAGRDDALLPQVKEFQAVEITSLKQLARLVDEHGLKLLALSNTMNARLAAVDPSLVATVAGLRDGKGFRILCCPQYCPFETSVRV